MSQLKIKTLTVHETNWQFDQSNNYSLINPRIHQRINALSTSITRQVTVTYLQVLSMKWLVVDQLPINESDTANMLTACVWVPPWFGFPAVFSYINLCLHRTIAKGTFCLLVHSLTESRSGCIETLIDRNREEKRTNISSEHVQDRVHFTDLRWYCIFIVTRMELCA
jgi:hypothetical protein